MLNLLIIVQILNTNIFPLMLIQNGLNFPNKVYIGLVYLMKCNDACLNGVEILYFIGLIHYLRLHSTAIDLYFN